MDVPPRRPDVGLGVGGIDTSCTEPSISCLCSFGWLLLICSIGRGPVDLSNLLSSSRKVPRTMAGKDQQSLRRLSFLAR